MVLMRRNIAHFRETCLQLAEWGIDEITFNQLGGNDRPEFYPDNRLQPSQVDDFIGEFHDVQLALSQRGVRLVGSERYLERIRATTVGRELPIDDCHPGESFLFVSESGAISPCSFTSGQLSGHISQAHTSESIASLAQRWPQERSQLQCAACRDCHATNVFDKFANPVFTTPGS